MEKEWISMEAMAVNDLKDSNRAPLVGSSFALRALRVPLSSLLAPFLFNFLGLLAARCYPIRAPQLFPRRLPLPTAFRTPCFCAVLLQSLFYFLVPCPVSISFTLALPFSSNLTVRVPWPSAFLLPIGFLCYYSLPFPLPFTFPCPFPAPFHISFAACARSLSFSVSWYINNIHRLHSPSL